MAIEIQAMASKQLPAKLSTSKPDDFITLEFELDEDAIADGETDPYDWMELQDAPENLSRLLGADEIVLKAAQATLVLTYPLDVPAIRRIHAINGKSFTRGELAALIDETYREVYRLETDSQSSPTPSIHERTRLQNRPSSDGMFCIWGHDLEDLAIRDIMVYRIRGRIWLHPTVIS